MQNSLKEIYVNLELVGEEKEAFFADRDNGKFELARHAMTADYLDPMGYLSMNIGSTTLGNTTDDAEFEKMVNDANLLSGQERMMRCTKPRSIWSDRVMSFRCSDILNRS